MGHETSANTGELVRNARDLNRIAASRPTLHPRAPLRLELVDLGEPDRARWEARLNRYYRMCGCKSSGWSIIVVLVGYVVLLMLAPDHAPAGWYRLAIAPVVVLAAAVAGKFIGLGVGALFFRYSIRSLRARIRSQPSVVPETHDVVDTRSLLASAEQRRKPQEIHWGSPPTRG